MTSSRSSQASVGALLNALRAYLHLPDADHVLFSLAVGVSAELKGDPLWGLLVGPPSSGKTEAIRLLDEVADDHLTEITAAGLLSWIGGKRPRPTGLLSRVGEIAFATIADLSTLLAASDRGQRDVLFGLLRRAYDGEVGRELGNAPEPLRWTGRLTLLAAVTPTIDNYTSHADALGPRWLYFRLPESDTANRRLAAHKGQESQAALEDHRAGAARLAQKVVAAASERAGSVELPPGLTEALVDASLVACLGRAAVVREGNGARQITAIPVIEEPPRLIGQMSLLARGLLGLGLEPREAERLCRRAALDSMPQARRRVLAVLSDHQELTSAAIARMIGADRKVARFALEELAAIGVCRYRGDEDDFVEEATRTVKWWRIAGEDAELVASVMRADQGGTKSVNHPLTPPSKEGVSHTSSHPKDRA